MRIKFWGTRGSLPAPITTDDFRIKAKRLLMNAQKVDLRSEAAIDAYLEQTPFPHASTYGGNTPCVEVSHEKDRLIIDCGSGMAILGREMMKEGFKPGGRVDILQTHTHWDHMIGFPFFAPAFTKDTEIHIHGSHPNLKTRFDQQMDLIHFPITMDEMKSKIFFHQLSPGQEFSLGVFDIINKGLHHPGGSYSYKISADGKKVVIATDGEYINLNEEFATYIEFYRDADALIFDAMFATLEQTIEKENYGHSTPVIGINIALSAKVKKLILFHHDHESNDSQIYESFLNAKKHLQAEKKYLPGSDLELLSAYDNLVVDI